jgi:hypothetical protein
MPSGLLVWPLATLESNWRAVGILHERDRESRTVVDAVVLRIEHTGLPVNRVN